ncbi:MAG: isoleucine--tRNA ligase, partial [Devosia nanyangense]|nr:isoleucine--tRNA ligase [Devosia nanyangense]
HLRQFPKIPADWANGELEAKWDKIKAVRRVVTGALEIERRNKVIGSSLEAAPKVFVSDEALLAALKDQDFAEIAITSSIEVNGGDGPADAFRLEEVAGVAVVPALAQGKRCARSWKILPEVGSEADFPDLSPRDAQAMRERAAAGLSV